VNKVDRLLLVVLRVLPKNILSRITGALARIPFPYPLNVLLLRTYSALFRVNLGEAEKPISQYHSLQSFFIRRLSPESRLPDTDLGKVLSPVDGRVIAAGRISDGTLLQAKGWRYPIDDLLGDRRLAAHFLEGAYATLYLSPADYHRIHMPLDGVVESLRYIPGHLFPVNRFSLNRIANLFVINERVTLNFRTGAGQMAMVLVGATNVGKIRICFDDVRRSMFRRGPFQRSYKGHIALRRAEEMGRFELGSTVIVLFEKERVRLDVQAGEAVRVGKALGFIP
jgi:phosphatidylserine decarboxylase